MKRILTIAAIVLGLALMCWRYSLAQFVYSANTEFEISVYGALGGLTSTAAATLLQTCTTALNAGHFTNLAITNDLNGGACTTAPTYNIRDATASTVGTAIAGSTTAGTVNQAETLAFAAGDSICIVRTVNGGTCTAPYFGVVAQIKEP